MPTEEIKSLVKKITNTAPSAVTEHILNIFKAGLATAPFCGGISSLLTDYIPNSKIAGYRGQYNTEISITMK